MFPFVALHGNVNTRVAQIVRNSHVGYGHHRQSWVFQFVTHNLRNLFAQRFSDALSAMHKNNRGWEPGAGSQDSSQLLTPGSCPLSLQFRRGNSLDHVTFDLVADLDIVKVLQPDTALEAFANLGSVVLKSA